MLDKRFVIEKINGHDHIYIPSNSNNKNIIQDCFLMPDYDEYGMSYKDKSFMVDKKNLNTKEKDNARLPHFIILNGVVAGTWTFTKKTEGRNRIVVLECNLPGSLSTVKQKALDKLTKRHHSFTKP